MMPNSDLKVLGEKFRTERKLAGLTQEQLAERCHVSTKHIANIEKGSIHPASSVGYSKSLFNFGKAIPCDRLCGAGRTQPAAL